MAVLVRLRLHRETMGTGESVYACIRVHGEVHPRSPSRISNRVHRDGWVQEIPCNSNSLNSYVVRLFSVVTPRRSPRPCVYVSLPSFYVSRDFKQCARCAVQFGSDYINECIRTDYM